VGGFHAYTIQLRDGRKLTFTSYLDGIEQLGATIVKETVCRLLPKSLVAFDAGDTLDFGPFQLSHTGISEGKPSLTWEQVGEACIDSEGLVAIWKREESGCPWMWTTAENVPNVHVLIPMVNEIVGRKPTL
jgi:hypothetical protein